MGLPGLHLERDAPLLALPLAGIGAGVAVRQAGLAEDGVLEQEAFRIVRLNLNSAPNQPPMHAA